MTDDVRDEAVNEEAVVVDETAEPEENEPATAESVAVDEDVPEADPLLTSRRGAIEAMLFVSSEPVAAAKLAEMIDATIGEVDAILCDLAREYEEGERGIQLREVAGGWRLYTHPAHHDLVERYVLSWDTQKLSQAALETLAVIAYNQPATRAMVASIRGVNSDAVISSLVEKGLVREAGRDTTIGQPILYATTRTFLEKFGLRTVRDLPPLEDFAANEETRRLIVERLSVNASESVFADEDDAAEDEDDLIFEMADEDDE